MLKKVIKAIINLILLLLLIILSYLPILAAFSAKWAKSYYANVTVEEIIFHLTSKLEGTSSTVMNSYLLTAIPPTIFIGTIIFILVFLGCRFLKKNKLYVDITIFKKLLRIRIPRALIIVLTLLLSIGCIHLSFSKVGFYEYLRYQAIPSNYIKKNYVDSQKIDIDFPEKKRNLIFIVVESLEATFFSEQYGGASEINYLEGLTELTQKNINFSNTDKIGGGYMLTSTGWTSSALVGMTSGLPLKMTPNVSQYTELNDLLPGAYTIGQVLEKEGYNQEFILGSDADFGNRKTYFENHGNYDIVDYPAMKKRKMISKDYYVFWGVEDSLLYSLAKKDLTKLAKKDEPFNLTLLTVNTHAEGGYLESSCPVKYEKQIENVFNCSANQLVDFIKWIQKQDFYKDTTIVITGDHPSMEPTAFDRFNREDYHRTIYNLFINSSVKPVNEKNRLFTVLDLYPTTLAALGVEIEGDRIALGTNLFSEKKTLMEEYGSRKKFNKELDKRSSFYNKNFLNKK